MVLRRIGTMALMVVAMGVVPAWAQTGQPASGASRIGARAFGHLEWQVMTAKDSFEAFTGETTLKGFGGGGEVQNLWRNVFLRASVSRMTEQGDRIFVFNNEVFHLGIPLELTVTPIEVAVGWRFTPIGSRGIVPYVGAGALFLKYTEDSVADSSTEGINETYNGFVLFGGVEVPVWRFIGAGAEVGWRKANVPDPAGALDAFGENDLGGVTMRVMLSIRK
jgi:opacity protein-like surface antigen